MIEISNLAVSYDQKKVYEGFNLSLEEGKITCVLGESGCGKTTLLNVLAGLVPYSGTVSPVKVSYVFQSPRLIPYIGVLKNLTVAGADPAEASAMLAKVGLGDRAAAYPQTLSGGEAQRVSLCRAFLNKSDILLMDEPFSSLDLKTKLSVMELFRSLHAQDGRTALFVTHDIDEAVYLSDRIAVVKNGGISADFINKERSEFGASSAIREQIVKCLLS